MTKTYNSKYEKYTKFAKPKISYICSKTLGLFRCCKCGNSNDEIFKEKESIDKDS